MKPLAWFLSFLIFFSVLHACTTRPQANVFAAEEPEKIDLRLPDGYLLLQEIKLDTDNDNRAETVLFGYKGNRILLLVFDMTPTGKWERHILANCELSAFDEVSIQDLICVVQPDWIGWGLPFSEPYEIYVWDGKQYSQPRFLM
jgi:hypothetical protein